MKGYDLRLDGSVNIFSVRRFPIQPNIFNDTLHAAIYLKEISKFISAHYSITTLPGKYWLANLMNEKGAAILKPGQYRDAYKLGTHKGKPALIQCKPVMVYRDKNLDDSYDLGMEESGMFGINIHRAGKLSHFVNSWSAGCQVFKEEDSFERFLQCCRDYAPTSGYFNYTLFDEGEI